MKKFLVTVSTVMLFGGLAYCQTAFMSQGSYIETNTPTEGVISITSTTYSTSASVDNGVIRKFQNVGATNVNYFYIASDYSSIYNHYLIPGEKYNEEKYFGDIYFIAPAGVSGSSVTYTTITYK